MAEFNQLKMTDSGRRLMAKLIASKHAFLKFDSVKTSSDSYDEESESIGTVKQICKVSSVVRVDESTVMVKAAVNNDNISDGYFINTVGIYAIDPDEGEILYAVTSAKSAVYMPPKSEIASSGMVFDFAIAVGNADGVEITVNYAATASQSDIMYINDQISDLQSYIGYTPPDIYGIEVDFENSKITRLADAVGLTAGADFDDIAPWHRRRCNVTHDGAVTAYYGDESYTETGKLTQEVTLASLTTYPVGTPVNVMVEQPPFYYKFVPIALQPLGDGKYAITRARYYISPTYKDGFKLHPVFDNAEQPVYLAAYESCLYNTETEAYEGVLAETTSVEIENARLASISGTGTITSGRTFTSGGSSITASQALKALSNYKKYTAQPETALAASQLLFLIEHASFDAKTSIGTGSILASESGRTTLLGNASGTVDGGVSYRGEENLWGHIWYCTNTPMLQNSNIDPLGGANIKAFMFSPLGASSGVSTQGLGDISVSVDTTYFEELQATGLFFCWIAALQNNATLVGDSIDMPMTSDETYILHGGKNNISANGLFALSCTNPDDVYTVRLFYSSQNAESAIRDADSAEIE